MGVKPQEALGYLLTARSIERIGDHATRIAINLKAINRKTAIDDKIFEIGNKILEMFNDSINALNRRELKYAHEVIKNSKNIRNNIEKLRQDIFSLKGEVITIVSLVYIIDSLERTRGYTEDIAETAINHHFV
jgi:phosphate uptake regulator